MLPATKIADRQLLNGGEALDTAAQKKIPQANEILEGENLNSLQYYVDSDKLMRLTVQEIKT